MILGAEAGGAWVALVPLTIYAVLFLGIFPARVIYQALIRNALFEHASLEGGHRFASTVHPPRMVWIAVSNAVVAALTLGLMLPWAQIRMACYLAEHTTLLPRGSLDDLAGTVEARATALGDAYADLEGVEAGLPV